MSEKLCVTFCDHLGLPRAKHVPISAAADERIRFCQSVFSFSMARAMVDSPGSKKLQGMPDMLARWNQNSLRNSWRKDEKIAICNLHDITGNELSLCGRNTLQRAIKDWQKRDKNLTLGIEFEAYAFVRNQDNKLVPLAAPGAYCYQVGYFCDPIGFCDDIWEAANRAQIPLSTITTECDESQFEFVLNYSDPITAADDGFLFKLMAREIAAKHGITLTFMPKPIAERGGSGVHLNFTFLNNDGTNALASLQEGEINNLASSSIAGLIKHHKALAGLLAPTTNSYVRLKPDNLAGYWANWGVDHRGTTIRLSEGFGKSARIEHRMCDGGANLYTASAAVFQAAKNGFDEKLELQPAETGNCFPTVDASVSVASNLGGALNDLEIDDKFCKALGKELVANHTAMKRNELSEVKTKYHHNNKADYFDAERDYYIHFI